MFCTGGIRCEKASSYLLKLGFEEVYQLEGGLRQGMGYTGSKDIKDLQKRVQFQKITRSGMTEGHVHDVSITKEAPNYRVD